ncbi:hypothetical protein PVAG01_03042 [Phlyctema vagabunda]|uniref:Uncharacterized protein n=1 Tax=Phlyctema vagabunda TaxID=108571 RepID=A0ABR4PSK8_9HELO
MENGGQGTGGPGGNNGNQAGGIAGGVGGGQAGDGAGAGASTTMTATTSSQPEDLTTSLGLQTSATSSPSATAAAATSSSSVAPSTSTSTGNGAIIGGVVGGIVGLIILAVIALWLLRRKKNKNREREREIQSIEPVTYMDLDSSFAGVRFGGGVPSPSSNLGHQDTLLPPRIYTSKANSMDSGVGIRSGEPSPYMRDSRGESAHFLHSYAESHSDTMSRTGRSSHGARSDHLVSPMTPTFQFPSPVAFQPAKPGLMRHETTDTMGFPVGHDEELDILSPMPRIHAPDRDTMDTMYTMDAIDTMGFPFPAQHTNSTPTPTLVYPASKSSLELQVKNGMSGAESPVLGFHDRHSSKSSGILQTNQSGKDTSSESSVANKLGISRNLSQRTMASVSDYGLDIISDDELERMGVGLGRRLTHEG